MKKIILVGVSSIAMLVSLLMLITIPARVALSNKPSVDNLLLLIQDDLINDTSIKIWENVAREEGIHVTIQRDTEFLLPIHRKQYHYPGIILPDTMHTHVSPMLAVALKDYVQNGGKLFLVYDAGTRGKKGQWLRKGATFSNMLYFNYATKEEPYETGIVADEVGQTHSILREIGIPPGKCMVDEDETIIAPNDSFCAISTYMYGRIKYEHFATKPIQPQIPLLLTTPDHQFIAGMRPYGKGEILFVNMPLTKLYMNTDGMLLHAFLHYFATNMLQLPVLSAVPNGVGGIVLNLHAESQAALEAFPILNDLGLFQRGPTSIDITVGPDVRKLDDKKGIDLLHNSQGQHWVKYLSQLGHAIGSDGGWMHDYFGMHVNEGNQKQFKPFINKNFKVLEKVLGKQVLEYVPSMGNQPNWVTRFIVKHKLLAYYTTSNTGSAPTINFREGHLEPDSLWSFPCLPLGQFASLRDFGFANLSSEIVENWLSASSDFVSREHTTRLIYFHPDDIIYFKQYISSLKNWLRQTDKLMHANLFHWYSMVDIATFLNARKTVHWQVEKNKEHQIITATHATSLVNQTWIIAKNTCDKPMITRGKGRIHQDMRNWIVSADDVKLIQFRCLDATSMPQHKG